MTSDRNQYRVFVALFALAYLLRHGVLKWFLSHTQNVFGLHPQTKANYFLKKKTTRPDAAHRYQIYANDMQFKYISSSLTEI